MKVKLNLRVGVNESLEEAINSLKALRANTGVGIEAELHVMQGPYTAIEMINKRATQFKCEDNSSITGENIGLNIISNDELIDKLAKKDMLKEDFIEKWSKHLIEYLRENYSPYTQIIVTTEGVRVTQDIKGTPCPTEG